MKYTIDRWFEKGEKTLINGHRIFHLSEGSGPNLVLLHGFPTSSWDWQWIWPELIQSYRVVALDFMGFGYSDKPKNIEYTISGQADIVEGLLQIREISSFHILSHDYGDTVAQELLARHHERDIGMQTLTMLNGGLFPETHRPRFIQRLLAGPFGSLVGRLLTYQKFASSFSEVFGPHTQPTGEELVAFWELIALNNGQRVYHKLIRYMAERRQNRTRWVGALQHAAIPLALINGVEDPVSGRHMVTRYREIVSNEHIYELAGIGHYPQTEAPEKAFAAFSSFHSSVL